MFSNFEPIAICNNLDFAFTSAHQMDFLDLDRMFAPLSEDKEVALDWGPTWGRKYGGWLNWPELLKRQRVVLLAEALSGKTKEFEFRVQWLRDRQQHAYFVRIEDLEDGFGRALDAAGAADFESWKAEGSIEGWFFLDSVDEARLNQKSFERALSRFADELGVANLGRAHVMVSCRVSDWKDKADRALLRRLLPFVAPPPPVDVMDPDETLLAPIFSSRDSMTTTKKEAVKAQPADLLVVQLAPLSNHQQRCLAEAATIANVDAFMDEVVRSGLEGMTERPGDMIGLLEYWKQHGSIGSLREMTEEGIRRKLAEEDTYRSDAVQLTPQQAREGAERLAAALVLGKSFTLRARTGVRSYACAGSA